MCGCVRLCLSVCLCRYVHMSAGTHGGHKRALDLLVLELQEVVNYLEKGVWSLTWSSGKTLASEPSFQLLVEFF